MIVQIKILTILLVCFIILNIALQISSYKRHKALFEKNKASHSDYNDSIGNTAKQSINTKPSIRIHIFGVIIFVIFTLIVFVISKWAIKNVPISIFWIHILIICLYFSMIDSYRFLYKTIKINLDTLDKLKWVLPLSDLVILIIGYWAFCNGAKNGVGEYREAYVERMVAEVRSDSIEIEALSKDYAALISDTMSINHYIDVINRIDLIGCPHLHGTIDTSFFYTDERIRGISDHNIKLASSAKEDMQSLYKVVYISQLREQFKDEQIFYIENGNSICFTSPKWKSIGDVTERYENLSDDLRKIGLKQIVFKWGDEESQSKTIVL